MIPFPYTSFLYALYRSEVHSSEADDFLKVAGCPLPVSSLLLLEFRQSVRLQVYLNRHDNQKGISQAEASGLLHDLETDLLGGILQAVPVDWAEVHRLADRMSAASTESQGHRLADILHVATAIHLGADTFLTFDDKQKLLAKAEGLIVPH